MDVVFEVNKMLAKTGNQLVAFHDFTDKNGEKQRVWYAEHDYEAQEMSEQWKEKATSAIKQKKQEYLSK